jgi:hypothetical protein
LDEPEDDGRKAKLARRSPFAPAEKLCPRCLNPLSAGSELGGWLVPQSYYCTKCGYSGSAFLERDQSAPPSED